MQHLQTDVSLSIPSMNHHLTTVIFSLSLLAGSLQAKNSPEILFADGKEVTYILPGSKDPVTQPLSELSVAGRKAIEDWLKSDEGKAAKRPEAETKEEVPAYNPKASYRERQQALNAFFKTIPDNFDEEWPCLLYTSPSPRDRG